MAIVIFLALGVALFFFWLSYSSPVNEAGRAFRKNVNAYQRAEIESMDDVYERLDVLESHFNSTTFDKMQGGEPKEVTRSDIEKLFKTPHEVFEEVEMSEADTVYQYSYDELTLNFHQRFQTIDEMVVEQFNETFYDASTLNQLFIDTIANHQSQYTKFNEHFELICEAEVPQLIENKTPTRSIKQSGWYPWSFNREVYFDNGSGEYSPTEYLALQFKAEDATELYLMERRFQAAYEELDTQVEVEKKNEALYSFSDFYEQTESDNEGEKLKVEDFSNAFGEIGRIIYDFRRGVLGVSWLINDGEYPEEIMAIVPVPAAENLSEISDLAELEITEFSTHQIFTWDRAFNNDRFIKRE